MNDEPWQMPEPAPTSVEPSRELLGGVAPREEPPLHQSQTLLVTALEWARTAIEAAALFVVVSTLVGRFEIHSISMEPNLHEGQRVIVSRLGHIWPTWLLGSTHASSGVATSPFALRRGQMVVFYERGRTGGDSLVKRVIAEPGETIELRSGRVYIDGNPIAEPYTSSATTCFANCGPFKLGADEYFVMGDNRANSRDSRVFGPISSDQIVGQVVARYWPPDMITVYP